TINRTTCKQWKVL
ncbi:hypothetical protein Zm00014a_040865, partial [Zea mays]